MGTGTESVAQDQLRAFVERVERLEEEQRAINDDKSEVYKEAKGSGFDVKVLRKLIADRRKDYSARMEFETLYDLYAAALGMTVVPVEPVVRAHVETPEEFDRETGEILEPQSPPETTPPDREADHHSGEGDHATGASAASVALIPDAGMETGVPDSGLSARIGAEAAIHSPETATRVLAQDSGGTAFDDRHPDHLADQSKAALPASVDANVNDGSHGVERGQEVVTGGESAAAGLAWDRLSVAVEAEKSASTPAPRTKAQIFDAMGLPAEPDPRCQKPHICDRTSHVKLCLDCRVAAGLEMEGAA